MEKVYIQLTKKQFIENFFKTGALFYSKEGNKILNRFPEDGQLNCYYYEVADKADEDNLIKALNNKREKLMLNYMKARGTR